MFLRDHPVLNLIRRLRGWTVGEARVMAEAQQAGHHFFCVFECRGATPEAREAAITAALAEDGATLVEIAEETAPSVPMPPNMALVALTGRIYFPGSEGGPDHMPVAAQNEDSLT